MSDNYEGFSYGPESLTSSKKETTKTHTSSEDQIGYVNEQESGYFFSHDYSKDDSSEIEQPNIQRKYPYELHLAVGTTIRRSIYHIINFCYLNRLIHFVEGNIRYTQYSIRMEADQSERNHSRSGINMISIEEDAFISSFLNEQLNLYNDVDHLICCSFIITSDRVPGNGRVLLHLGRHSPELPHTSVKPSVSSKSECDPSPISPSSLHMSDIPSRPQRPQHPMLYVAPAPLVQQTVLTLPTKYTKNRSIIARASLSVAKRPQSSKFTRILSKNEMDRFVGDSVNQTEQTKSVFSAPLSAGSQESSSPGGIFSYGGGMACVRREVGERSIEDKRLSDHLLTDTRLSHGVHDPFTPFPLSPHVSMPSEPIQPVAISPPTLTDFSKQADPLASLFSPISLQHDPHKRPVSSLLTSFFSIAATTTRKDSLSTSSSPVTEPQFDIKSSQVANLTSLLTSPPLTPRQIDQCTNTNHQAIKIGLMTSEVELGESDAQSIFTHNEAGSDSSDGWFFQRTTTSKQEENERSDDVFSHQTDQLPLPSSRPIEKKRETSLSSRSSSSFQSFFTETNSESLPSTIPFTLAHFNTAQAMKQYQYCQHFGCHRVIYDSTSTADRCHCRNCGFIFCDEHRPCSYAMDIVNVMLCDSCYQILQSNEKNLNVVKLDQSSSPMEEDSEPNRLKRPVTVTFSSPPLGITLQCGENSRGANLLQVKRYDNNDYIMKVPLNSSVLQINDHIVLDEDYLEIIKIAKQVTYPITIIFGSLSNSTKDNLKSLLSLSEKKRNRCNYHNCSHLFNNDKASNCSVCERRYCDDHCCRLLFLDSYTPSAVCEFCISYIFKPFDAPYLAKWVPDYYAAQCMEPGCITLFLSLRHPMRKRRHHCRLCGNIFCDKHCDRRVVLSEFSSSVGVRVCNKCNIIIQKFRDES